MASNGGRSKWEQRQIEQRMRIEEKLKAKGLRLADIDRAHALPRGTAANTMIEPHARGERAIAAALGTRPELLWRDRYHASGQRKSPQNYTRVKLYPQRRNDDGGQTAQQAQRAAS